MPRKQFGKDIVLSTPVPKRRKAPAMPVERAEPVVEEMPVTPAATDGPSPEQIALLAYSYWEARGGQGGSAEEDWLRAEQELRLAVGA